MLLARPQDALGTGPEPRLRERGRTAGLRQTRRRSPRRLRDCLTRRRPARPGPAGPAAPLSGEAWGSRQGPQMAGRGDQRRCGPRRAIGCGKRGARRVNAGKRRLSGTPRGSRGQRHRAHGGGAGPRRATSEEGHGAGGQLREGRPGRDGQRGSRGEFSRAGRQRAEAALARGSRRLWGAAGQASASASGGDEAGRKAKGSCLKARERPRGRDREAVKQAGTSPSSWPPPRASQRAGRWGAGPSLGSGGLRDASGAESGGG